MKFEMSVHFVKEYKCVPAEFATDRVRTACAASSWPRACATARWFFPESTIFFPKNVRLRNSQFNEHISGYFKKEKLKLKKMKIIWKK